jgi:hypothetical protein
LAAARRAAGAAALVVLDAEVAFVAFAGALRRVAVVRPAVAARLRAAGAAFLAAVRLVGTAFARRADDDRVADAAPREDEVF